MRAFCAAASAVNREERRIPRSLFRACGNSIEQEETEITEG
jgi:hypothetical protein